MPTAPAAFAGRRSPTGGPPAGQPFAARAGDCRDRRDLGDGSAGLAAGRLRGGESRSWASPPARFLDARQMLRDVRDCEMLLPAAHFHDLLRPRRDQAADLERAFRQCLEAYPDLLHRPRPAAAGAGPSRSWRPAEAAGRQLAASRRPSGGITRSARWSISGSAAAGRAM